MSSTFWKHLPAKSCQSSITTSAWTRIDDGGEAQGRLRHRQGHRDGNQSIAHARCPVCNPRPQPLSANQPQIPYDHIFERWGIAPDFRYWQFCDMARGKDALSPGADISALVRMKPVYAFTA